LGELGAAAALAGLLFVSISVNQERILELGRMADRGLEALTVLFLVIVVTSLVLVPGQPLRLLGGEIAAAGGAVMVVIVALQNAYLRDLDPKYRPPSTLTAWFNRLAVALTALPDLPSFGGTIRLDFIFCLSAFCSVSSAPVLTPGFC
jgi:hypothetical protein